MFLCAGSTVRGQPAGVSERPAAAARRWEGRTLTPYRGAKIVSYHDSWPYFYPCVRARLRGIIEDRPGIPPSPQHLASLIQQMKAEKVKVILLETRYPADVAKLVARESGAKVLARRPQTPGAVQGTEDYVAHRSLTHLVTAVANALQ